MNKKKVLFILFDLVFLVIFNIVFFVVSGTDHPVSVWLSYGFIHFAYLMILVTPLLIRKSSSASIFGFSIYSVSTIYFIVEFIVGLILIFVQSDSYKASLVVQIIIAGIYAVILLANMIANEYTADSIDRHEDEVEYIKKASSRVKLLIDKVSEKKANKEIKKVYDLLHSCPTRSIATVKTLEEQIVNKISELESAVSSNSTNQIIVITAEITSMIEERNRKLRIAN